MSLINKITDALFVRPFTFLTEGVGLIYNKVTAVFEKIKAQFPEPPPEDNTSPNRSTLIIKMKDTGEEVDVRGYFQGRKYLKDNQRLAFETRLTEDEFKLFQKLFN
jgi:hypothetical protein